MSKFGPGTIETFSGEAYHFEAPDPLSVHFVDIEHALSNICRFAGHVREFCSVAEHSVLVSRILEKLGYTRFEQALGLMHDGHETFVWDAPRPFKPLLGDRFRDFAWEADKAIAEAIFGNIAYAPRFSDACIKEADNIALCAEREALMTSPPEDWEPGYEDVPALPAGLQVYGLEPRRAKFLFHDRAIELGLTKEGTFA